MTKMTSLRPTDSRLYRNRADYYRASGNNQLAVRDYSTAIRLAGEAASSSDYYLTETLLNKVCAPKDIKKAKNGKKGKK
ncbi:MAG: hypothetical protein V2A77_08580 [Pseudomonadota bacterium]